MKQQDLFDEIDSLFNKSTHHDLEKKDVLDTPTSIDEKVEKWGMYGKIINLCEDDSKDNRKLKSKYGIILLCVLIAQLIIINIFFYLKGIEYLKCSDLVFNYFITGTFIEIISLVIVIVKFLFNDNLGDALKIILSNSKNEGR